MKSQILLAIILPSASFAQSPTPSPSAAPSASPPHHAPIVLEHAASAPLTAGQRGTLIAASKKALEDPNVQAAAATLHEAKQALDNAMIAKDPTLKPILDKIAAASIRGIPHTRLTPGELQQLHAARESMKGTPEVHAWLKASADYRDALHQATLASDPAVAGILAKLPQGAPAAPRSAVSPSASPAVSP